MNQPLDYDNMRNMSSQLYVIYLTPFSPLAFEGEGRMVLEEGQSPS